MIRLFHVCHHREKIDMIFRASIVVSVLISCVVLAPFSIATADPWRPIPASTILDTFQTIDDQGMSRIDLDIRFEINSANLTKHGSEQLDQLGTAIQALGDQESKFEIIGHTDVSGGVALNITLSSERARTVAGYLEQEFRIAESRMNTSGVGSQQLRDPANPTGAINRRVEIVVVFSMKAPAEAPASIRSVFSTIQ